MSKETKKIVFINQAAGYLTIDIVNAFTKKYDVIDLIAGSVRVQDIELDNKVKITKILKHSRKSNLKRILAWILGSLQIFFLLLFKYRKYEVFYFSLPPMAYFSSLVLRNKFSLLVFDVYPDVLKMFKIKESNLIYKLWASVNKKLFLKVHKIFTITPVMADLLTQYIPLDKIHLIPLWAGLTKLQPIPKRENSFVNEHNLENKFVIQYSGNISPGHHVELLVELAKELKNENDIFFLIIGRGLRQNYIQKLINKYELQNCATLPFQPDEVLKYSLASADLGVILLDDKLAQISIPSKVYNLMAVGAPLLYVSPDGSELSRYAKIYKNGKCFEKEDLTGMKNFILELKDNEKLLSEYKTNSLKASLNFTYKNAERFLEIYEENS